MGCHTSIYSNVIDAIASPSLEEKTQPNKHLPPWKPSSSTQTPEFMFPKLFKVYPGIQRLRYP